MRERWHILPAGACAESDHCAPIVRPLHCGCPRVPGAASFYDCRCVAGQWACTLTSQNGNVCEPPCDGGISDAGDAASAQWTCPDGAIWARGTCGNRKLGYPSSVLVEPLSTADAKALILAAINAGTLVFSSHALRELKKDDKTTVDAVNVLRGGIVQPAEFENGSWRYRVLTVRMGVVVAFRSEAAVVVVTAWKVSP